MASSTAKLSRRKGSGRRRLLLMTFLSGLFVALVTICYSTVLSFQLLTAQDHDGIAVLPHDSATSTKESIIQTPRVTTSTSNTSKTIRENRVNRNSDDAPKAPITFPRQKGTDPNSTTIISSAENIPRPTNVTKLNVTVAYAVSLVKCGDHQSTEEGLIDASLVMRHSIHLTHLQSKYHYKMYAIVHEKAVKCSGVLRDSGFEIVVVAQPINRTEIRGEFLRNHIQREWCCGHQEFIKLFAYSLPHPIIVHADIDFAFYQPMDHLFDAIMYDKDSPEGQLARSYIALERPEDGFPDKIDAFITRDWPQVIPGRKAMYQAGFLVARHDPSTIEDALEVVREGDYVDSFGHDNGWGGLGYGGFVGSMAMQGLMAYFYDVIRPKTAVELNQCRFNHMGMDTRYRAPPNFMRNRKNIAGKCRNDGNYCEDCTITPVKEIFNVHYTQCRKPWNCIGGGWPGGKRKEPADSIDTNAGNYLHCMNLIEKWHNVRADFETKLYALTGDESVPKGREGDYKQQYFHGHCRGDGGKFYIPITGTNETFHMVSKLYGDT